MGYGMASLRDQFQRFYAPDAGAIAGALRTGLVVPDTNVLLSLYRFQAEARDELLGVLERLEDRLWVPYQVALEFHQNRLNVIAEQERFFGKAREDLDASLNEYATKLRTFANRIALGQSAVQELEEGLRKAHAIVTSEVYRAEQANEVHLDNRDCDGALSRLEVLLSNRVGEPMSPSELDTARKEAQKRFEAKIPPGYKDRGKPDPSGDYLIWKQFIVEAKKRQVPAILITDDRKEDWFRREHGLTLGPRIELCEEMETEAGVPFLLMTSETFLVQAKEHLRVPVSATTVDQAKKLPESIEEHDDLMARRSGIQERITESTGRLNDLLAVRSSLERAIRDPPATNLATGQLPVQKMGEINFRISALREEVTALQAVALSLDSENLQ